MTTTRSKVERVTESPYNVLIPCSRKPIVVSILPGDVLEFREQRSRSKFSIPIDTAFRMVVQRRALAIAREKRLKKKGGS